jgi:exosortase/archaeosortase family protein
LTVVCAAAAALWGPLLWRWARAWAASPDQAYGWGVPVLAGYLLAQRIKRGPDAQAPGTGERWTGAVLFAGGLLATAACLPVLEANTLWPTAQFWGAGAAMVATVGALIGAGGWDWAKWYVFPLLFLTTALTWPTPVKVWVVGTLAESNARMAAEVVSAAGHPAVVQGTVIAVRTGLVGVEEACSGLRSLQAVWMVAWFAGEFFFLNWPRRVFLAAASMGAALAANVARTIFLTWMAAAAGLTASESWHDTAGDVELAVGLGAVAWLAWRGYRGQRTRVASRAVAAGGREGAGVGAAGGRGQRPRLQLWVLAATVLVMAGAEIGTQGWYRSREYAAKAGLVHWRLGAAPAGWRDVPVPPREVSSLGSSEAAGRSVRAPAAPFPCWVFLVSWEGDAARGENPEWHDPAICLPASGARLVAELGTVPVTVGGRSLPFAAYRFVAAGAPVLVYFCHWDAETAQARAEQGGAAEDYRARRWQRVREGRRQGDVAHIAFVVQTSDSAAADAWVRRWAPVLLHPVAG